jgi:hypothetical protein
VFLKCFAEICGFNNSHFYLFYCVLGQRVVRDIQRTVKGAEVELMLLNLDSLESVKDVAAKLHATVDKVLSRHNKVVAYALDIKKIY